MAFSTEEKNFICSVCGKESLHTVITETDPPAGVPDLDLRPAGAPRKYMKYQVMECPHCGYCNSALNIPFYPDKKYLDSEEYRSCTGILTANTDAQRLIKKALVLAGNHSYKDAVKSWLSAAWLFDDDCDRPNAASCRRSAVRLMDDHPAAFKGDNNFKILMADLLRRSGEFERVIREYEGEAFRSQIMTAIAFFEVQLAAQGDDEAHRADEVPGVSAK